ADFIAEGVDQTRGWFFTLHAIAGMIFDKTAYKAVISNGLVLDRFGNKMSKRLGNAVNPFEAIAEFGSDPLRWYMISNSSPWDNLRYDSEGVRETSRKLFATLYNTYSFFAQYANLDNFDNSAPQVDMEERPEIDRWILKRLNSLILQVEAAFDDYEPTKAARAISSFVIDDLSNWHVRLNRKRFWGKEMDTDKLSAFQTLYHCLETIALLMAPISPFFADQLYTDLTSATTGATSSVHLADFPKAGPVDPELEERMSLTQEITSMVLALRRKVNIKVRQPLRTLMIPVASDRQRAMIEPMTPLLLNEVNVKDIRFVTDEDGVLVKRVKPDFKKLGPKHGKNMKAVAAAIAAMTQQEISALQRDGAYTFADINGTPATVDASDVEIISEDMPGWQVATNGALTVALDVSIDDALRAEGLAREIINRVQNIRKNRGYEISDRISLTFAPDDALKLTLADHADYIASQVLATSLNTSDISGDDVEELDIDGLKLYVKITRN
ncbi:MAG: class I tRNA ligase family protein, partial [Muribaculum sp.]|nr:class I tRNA ligase family protein [Muribaculum sp.]